MSLESRILELQDASLSSRKIALLRIDSMKLEKESKGASSERNDIHVGGLANELNGLFREALLEWDSASNPSELLRMLKIIENVTTNDETLSEEIDTTEGFRDTLQKVRRLQQLGENKSDLFKSMQDVAIQIETSLSKLETVDKTIPFTESEIKGRLPLVINISRQSSNWNDLNIMIHQVTSEKETETHDTGYVMWPASVILSRYIAKNPSLVLDLVDGNHGHVLELGAGCGLVGLTVAAMIRNLDQKKCEESKNECCPLTSSVIFTDYLPMVLENVQRNIWLNGFDKSSASVAGLDFFDQPGNYDSKYDSSQPNWINMTGAKQPQVRLVVAADILPYSNDGVNVANTIFAALVEGGKAFLISPGENKRFGVGDFPDACRNAGLDVSILRIDVVDSGNGGGEDNVKVKETPVEYLDQDLHLFEDNFNQFYIFEIEKPSSSK